MDLTVNLFTSFGYFAQDEEHTDALGQMLATVRPGGWFVIDFLNADRSRASLVPAEDDLLRRQRRRGSRARSSPDGRFVCKTITLADGRRFEERVRLFGPDELERMLVAHGAVVRAPVRRLRRRAARRRHAATILTAQVPG